MLCILKTKRIFNYTIMIYYEFYISGSHLAFSMFLLYYNIHSAISTRKKCCFALTLWFLI
jgi:hypothetical protein